VILFDEVPNKSFFIILLLVSFVNRESFPLLILLLNFLFFYNLDMSIFKRSTYTWWQIGLLKLALVSIGIAIGASWSNVFLPYAVPLVILGVVLGLYLLAVWMKK